MLFLFGLTVVIEMEQEETWRALRRQFSQWPELADHDGSPDLSIKVFSHGAEYRVFSRTEFMARATNIRSLMYSVQCLLDEFVVSHVTGLAALHAGAWVRNGSGILLPGQSYAGKSVMVNELVRDGWTYYSDEYALIDNGGNVHAYPRMIFLRSESGEPMPVHVDGRVGGPPASVRLVLELEYLDHADWRVGQIGQSESFMRLLKSTPQSVASDPQIFGPLLKLTKSSTYYAGVRGEAVQALPQVSELFTSLG